MLRRKQNIWPFGSSPKKRVRRSEAELAQIAAEHKAAESGYFGSRSGSRVVGRRVAAEGYRFAIRKRNDLSGIFDQADGRWGLRDSAARCRFAFRQPVRCESVPQIVERERVPHEEIESGQI